jgi:hypothetical protein
MLITTKVHSILKILFPKEMILDKLLLENSLKDLMDLNNISTIPCKILLMPKLEPVETQLLSSKNLKKKPTSSKLNSLEEKLMLPNSKTI